MIYYSHVSCKEIAIQMRNDFFSVAELALGGVPGQQEFDPSSRVFSQAELKPQPIIKKSRKQV